MKTRRAIYITLGSFLIILNILIDITNKDKPALTEQGNAYSIGYLIGSHLLLLLGIGFLVLAFRVHKKIKSVRIYELNKEINEIGK